MTTSKYVARLVAAAAVVFASALASAQTTQTSCPTPGDLTSTTVGPVTTTSTTGVATGFTAATAATPCNFVTLSPLGTKDCTNPRTLFIAWNIATAQYASGGTFQIFAAPNNAQCGTYAPASSSDFFYNDSVTSVQPSDAQFPGGIYNSLIPLDTRAIMDAGGCCAGVDGITGGGSSSGSSSGDSATAAGGVCDGRIFNLCVVVQNDAATPKGVANGYLQFYVDTVRPVAVTGVTVSNGDGAITVHWDAQSGINKYEVTVTAPDGTSQTVETLNGATSATISNLKNGVTYTVTVQAIDFALNPGDPSAQASGTPEDQCDFWECYQGKEKGGFCFISTAAYGSYDAGTTQVFRDFRDRVLLKFSAGEKLVLWYYTHGAKPAVWLAQHAWARRAVAAALWPVALAAGLVVRAGPGSFMLICGALALLIIALRRTRAAWLAVFLVAFAGTARAQSSPIDSGGIQDDRAVNSDLPAQSLTLRPRWGVGVKIGPYRPNIDSDPGALGIYRRFFGQSDPVAIGQGRKILLDAEVDLYIYRGVGLLGLSGSAGYWTATATSLICKTANGDQETCSPDLIKAAAVAPVAATATKAAIPGAAGYATGSDKTSLNMLPLSISVVYKFDYLYQHWHVPFTPMVRGGFDGVFWWVEGSGREAVNRQKKKGEGLTMGYHFRPGVEISLDWLEPDSARRAFQNSGIFSSALTAEWIFTRIDDFGSSKSWNLSDNTFLAGVELNF